MSERFELVADLAAVLVTACAAAMTGVGIARGAPIENCATWIAGVGTVLTAMVTVAPTQ